MRDSFRLCFVLPLIVLVFSSLVYVPVASAQAETRTAIFLRYEPLANILAGSESQTPVVSARIYGYSYRFFLDSGSVISLLKLGAVSDTGLVTSDAPTLDGDKALTKLLGMNGKLRGTTVPALELGDGSVRNVFFYVTSEGLLDAVTKGDASFGGILGANFLKDNAVYIDPQTKSLKLFRKGNVTDKERSRLGFDAANTTLAALVPAKTVPDQFLVDMLCNDKTVHLFVDTGAEHTYLHRSPSEFGVSSADTQEFRTNSVYGKTAALAASVTLELGKSRAPNLFVHFEQDNGSEGDGLLGMDFLSRYIVLIDIPARKLYLRPRSAKGS